MNPCLLQAINLIENDVAHTFVAIEVYSSSHCIYNTFRLFKNFLLHEVIITTYVHKMYKITQANSNKTPFIISCSFILRV